MNYVLFVSDVHLQESEPQKVEIFLEFLRTTAIQAQALYILGDLFEAWIGDDVATEFNKNIQQALKKLSSSNVTLYLMRGNRDFLLGNKFAENTGSNILADPFRIDLYGKPTLLTHGDLLCTKDHTLMWFRKYAHNPKLHRYFLMLPTGIRKFLAQKIRAKSKRDAAVKTDETKGVVTATVLDLMRKYEVAQVIHGHVHSSAIHEIDMENVVGRRITLGAWDNKPNFMVYYEDHTVRMVN